MKCFYCDKELLESEKWAYEPVWPRRVEGHYFHLACHFRAQSKNQTHESHAYYCHLDGCDKFQEKPELAYSVQKTGQR